MTQTIIVCADDYAQTPQICDAIIDLAQRGRISAISCMTNSPLWPEQAKRLLPLRDHIDIGVHLVLIDEKPLTRMPIMAPNGRLPSLERLLASTFFTPRFGSGGGRYNRAEAVAEIAAQCDAFVAAMGAPPSHIDGHRHTHALSHIRQLVLDAAARFTPRPYIRSIVEPAVQVLGRGIAVPKTLFIAALGSRLVLETRRMDISMNDGFSGVYSLSPTEDYPALFARFIKGVGNNHLVMCHPGGTDDPLGATRAHEYAFFKSNAYVELLARNTLSVGRLST